MSSGGGGEDGRGGAISCDEVEIVVCLFSGMNWGGGMLLGGGGARGGGGSIIIGGLDLSTTDGTFEGVRERVSASSTIAADNVDSMDCRRSEAAVRGRGMNDALVSRSVASGGTGGMGNAVVVGPADGGGDMNWNC